jgi:hypothetical protein
MKFLDDDSFFKTQEVPATFSPANANDERNGGESLRRSEATEKGLSSIAAESPTRITASSGPSFLTKLLILLIPMLMFAGFYTYSQVRGAVARTTATAVNPVGTRVLDDPVNSVGMYTSIAIGSDGYPVISYQDFSANALKLYKCDNAACSLGTASTLDDPVNAVGSFSSIAIGSDGYPVISYWDNAVFALKLYKCDNAACSSGTARTLEDVVNGVGMYTSIDIGSDGYPVISYQDVSANALKFYKCDNIACSSGTARTLDDPANLVGFYTSITIGTDGYPVISYLDLNATALKLYKCDNAACSSGTARTLEDVANIVGFYTSITIGTDGYPVISYQDDTATALKLYKCDNTACSSGTARTLEDVANSVGAHTSIAIGDDGYPVISYQDATAAALKLYKCDNAACSSGTASTLEDISNQVGEYTSIAIGTNGYPVISYHDTTAGALKFAYVPSREVIINSTPTTTGTTLGTGLVGHWTFDGNAMTATAALDSSGGGNTATLSNVATSSRVPGKIGQALNFNYLIDSGVTIATPPASLNNLTTRTVSAWIKPGSVCITSSVCRIVTKSDLDSAGWNFRILFGVLGFKVKFTGVDGEWWTSAVALSANQWAHVVVTYDSSSTANVPLIYVNGIRKSVDTQTSPTGTLEDDTSNQFKIGNSAGLGETFMGLIDDVRVYNRILPADEIADLYSSGVGTKINTTATTTGATGLVGHWTFDGPDLTTATATDKSGRENNGVLTAGPIPAIGKVGQGLQFDGVDDYINLGIDGATPDLDLTAEMTISAWVKLNGNYTADQTIIGRYDFTSARAMYVLNFGSFDNYFTFTSGTAQIINTQSPISDTNWHHIAVTRSGSAGDWTITLYVDNVAYTQQTATNPQTDLDENTTIGKTPDVNSGYFNGRIDDVRVFNRALTADEIADLYSGTK